MTYDSVSFRYLTANTHPDHDTLAAFRRSFLPQIEALFVQVLVLAREMKLLKLGKIALDGTKIRTNASKHKALSYVHAQKIEGQLQDEVKALLARAQAADREKPADGMDVPTEIACRQVRLTALFEAKAKIEARAAERFSVEQKGYGTQSALHWDHNTETGCNAAPSPGQSIAPLA